MLWCQDRAELVVNELQFPRRSLGHSVGHVITGGKVLVEVHLKVVYVSDFVVSCSQAQWDKGMGSGTCLFCGCIRV